MKIPETTTNHVAYYTNEENGQWQGNGVIVDTGVGGGIVGSGDAGFQPSLYPIPHETGYVMSGPAYYPAAGYAAPPPNDFSDYMWMENEEEFDKQVMQQLEEEALMEQCIEAMLEDERRERNRSRHGGGRAASLEQAVSRSTLNPLAAEFVPSFTRSSTSIAQEKEKPPEPAAAAASSKDDKQLNVADKLDSSLPATNHEVTNNQDPTPPATTKTTTTTTTTVNETEPPTEEPSVTTLISPTDSKTVAPVKPKCDVKKGGKGDVAPTAKAKSKPHTAKSEPKVATASKCEASTKREAKTSRSEEVVSEVVEATISSIPVELKSEPIIPLEEPAPFGMKPINYAAAAKANKPKKATTPPVVAEKSQTSIHQTNSVKTSSAPSAKTIEIRSEKPTSREKLAAAPKSAKSTEKLRKNSSK